MTVFIGFGALSLGSSWFVAPIFALFVVVIGCGAPVSQLPSYAEATSIAGG
jgi:hypothetical protein